MTGGREIDVRATGVLWVTKVWEWRLFSGICCISFTCARVVQGALELVRLRSEAEQERRAEAKEQRMQSRIYSSYAESRLS